MSRRTREIHLIESVETTNPSISAPERRAEVEIMKDGGIQSELKKRTAAVQEELGVCESCAELLARMSLETHSQETSQYAPRTLDEWMGVVHDSQ